VLAEELEHPPRERFFHAHIVTNERWGARSSSADGLDLLAKGGMSSPSE
jgi:hypothetical protein